jgi:hypothetical protein
MKSTTVLAQEAREVADWKSVISLYAQCLAIAKEPQSSYLPTRLTGRLAASLDRLASTYRDSPIQMSEHALGVFGEQEDWDDVSNSEEIFRRLYEDERFRRFSAYFAAPETQDHRRRPIPFESCVETTRRLRDIKELRDNLVKAETAAVVGGSMSYGRFFNVSGSPDWVHDKTGSRKSSDLDLLLVVPDHELPVLLERLNDLKVTMAGVDEKSIDQLSERLKGYRPGELDHYSYFSHDIHMWTKDQDPVFSGVGISPVYYINLHILTRTNFEFVLLRDITRLEDSAAAPHREILDYRENPPRHERDHQRSFSGTDLWLKRNQAPAECSAGGFIVSERVFAIREDRYHPGMLQNLVLPLFDLNWDNTRLRWMQPALDEFKSKIFERLRHERQERPHELNMASLAHTRSEVFSPVTKQILDIDPGGVGLS